MMFKIVWFVYEHWNMALNEAVPIAFNNFWIKYFMFIFFYLRDYISHVIYAIHDVILHILYKYKV